MRLGTILLILYLLLTGALILIPMNDPGFLNTVRGITAVVAGLVIAFENRPVGRTPA